MLQRSPVFLDVLVSAMRARKLLHDASIPLHPKEFVIRAVADWNALITRCSEQIPISTIDNYFRIGNGSNVNGTSYYKQVLIPFLLFHEYIINIKAPGPTPLTQHLQINPFKVIIPEHLHRLNSPYYGSFYEGARPKSIPIPWVNMLQKATALLLPIDSNHTSYPNDSNHISTDPNGPIQKRLSLKDRFAYYYVRTTSEMSRKKRHVIKEGNRLRKHRAKKALRKERARLRLISTIRKSSNTSRNILRAKLGEERYTQLLAAATSKASRSPN